MKALPPYRVRALHVAAAWAFSVSQPIFSLLLANPEFLVVRGATRGEVIFFALVLTFVPPIAAVAFLRLVSLVSRRAADILYLAFLTLLVAALAAQILKKLGVESSAIIFVALGSALVLGGAYVRWAPVRHLVTFAVSLSLIGALWFVVRAPIVREDVAGANVGVASETPVVLIVFDEFPVSSLMTPARTIDSVRYPNIARLARSATWYRRATTVHESTTRAVPAILTGKLQQHGGLPTLTHHPENLFTLLGERYRFNVTEQVTYLCPRRYCKRVRTPFTSRMKGLFADVEVAYLHRILPESVARSLPRVDERWGDFKKERILVAGDSRELFDASFRPPLPGEYTAFLRRMAPAVDGRALHFIHLMLPHSPWRLLPSGRDMGKSDLAPGVREGVKWADKPWWVRQAYQRHLLQVGYVDRLIGRLLRRLRGLGIYDRALVVITADHGISFVPGQSARAVDRHNLADVAHVPLFVKYPGQREGRIDDRAVRSIDIVPTVADVLDVNVPWPVDGHSLLTSWPRPKNVTVATVSEERVQAPVDEAWREVESTIRRRAQFGPTWESLYAAGLRRRLRGLELDFERLPGLDEAHVYFDTAEELANVDLSSSHVPVWLTGSIEGVRIPPDRELAVAVNGRIVAPARTVAIYGYQKFTALVPEHAFHDGFNRVVLLAVEEHGNNLRLTQLGTNA